MNVKPTSLYRASVAAALVLGSLSVPGAVAAPRAPCVPRKKECRHHQASSFLCRPRPIHASALSLPFPDPRRCLILVFSTYAHRILIPLLCPQRRSWPAWTPPQLFPNAHAGRCRRTATNRIQSQPQCSVLKGTDTMGLVSGHHGRRTSRASTASECPQTLLMAPFARHLQVVSESVPARRSAPPSASSLLTSLPALHHPTLAFVHRPASLLPPTPTKCLIQTPNTRHSVSCFISRGSPTRTAENVAQC